MSFLIIQNAICFLRVLRSVERFDPKTGTWSEVRSMGVARMAMASVKYRDYIWVAGGMTGEKKNPVCKIVECYNSKTNECVLIFLITYNCTPAILFLINYYPSKGYLEEIVFSDKAAHYYH